MLQLKNTVLAVLALGVLSVSSAATYVPSPASQPQPTPMHGFYIGAGLGGIAFTTETNMQQDSATGSGSIDVSNTLNTSSNDGNIGLNSVLYVGYNWTFANKLFLGTEVFGNVFNTGSSTTSAGTTDVALAVGDVSLAAGADITQTSHLTYNNAYGIRALPGYRVSQDAVIYGIVGYSRAHARNTGFLEVTTETDITTPTFSNSFDDVFNFNGYQLGLGSMINLNEHVAVRGDLIYTGYGKETLWSSTFSDGTSSENLSITAEPSSLEADVSVVYMFD